MQHCLFHLICAERVLSTNLSLSTAAPSAAPSARRRALLAGIPALLAAPALYAQTKPVTTLTVPFPPGAGPDIAARLIGEKLAERLGHTVVVENKPGAGALIGAAAVARATADGTQLLLTPNTLVISPHVLPKGPNSIDPTRDLVPVSPLGITPTLDQTRLLEHLQVARDRGQADRERLGELEHRRLARGEPRDDRTPGWVGECGEGGVERPHLYLT